MKKISIWMICMVLCNVLICSANERAEYSERIEVNIPSRTLTIFKNEEISKVYPVAVGKLTSKTPVGNYRVLNKAENPYYSRKKIPGGSPKNPLGIRWIGFRNHYGIHGNSSPYSIGKVISGGCIRMYNYDVKELYAQVSVGAKVDVTYDVLHVVDSKDENFKGLIIYTDVYKRKRKIKENIERKLKEEGVIECITHEKIKEAVVAARNKTAVLSEKWAVIMNNHYVTIDTYADQEGIYVSEEFLDTYFGLNIEDSENGKCVINGVDINYKMINEKRYVLLRKIRDIIGGKLSVNNKLQNIWYDVSIVKLNGEFLEVNNSKVATHKPFIPIAQLSKALEKNIKDQTVKIKGTEYMDLEKVKKNFGVACDYHSVDKRIELYAYPLVTSDQDNQNVLENVYEKKNERCIISRE